MTTVAFKAGVMACDSCWTRGDMQVVSGIKIRRLSSGALFGTSGDNDVREVEALLDKVRTPKQMPLRSAFKGILVDCGGILVLPRGKVFMIGCREKPDDYDDEIGAWEVNRGFAAIGSGAEVALGAMAAGKSAREAVAIACKFDINSRLPVHVLKFA